MVSAAPGAEDRGGGCKMASVLQGAGIFGFIGNGHHLHLILKQRLFSAFIYLFIFLQREVLAWGRLLANHRSSEVQVLLPR